MVVFDASVLIDLLNPRTASDRRAKLENLISELQKSKSKIQIPTPALSEFLAGAGKAVIIIIKSYQLRQHFRSFPLMHAQQWNVLL